MDIIITAIVTGAVAFFAGCFWRAAFEDADIDPYADLALAHDSYIEGLTEGLTTPEGHTFTPAHIEARARAWIAEQIAEGNLPAAY